MRYEGLFALARSMLTEEAVRCTAHLVRLLQLSGLSKVELEEARGIYVSIVQDHLGECTTLSRFSIPRDPYAREMPLGV